MIGVTGYDLSRGRQRGLSYVSKKILTWMLRETTGGLTATVSNRKQPDYHLSIQFFVLFGFYQPESCFP